MSIKQVRKPEFFLEKLPTLIWDLEKKSETSLGSLKLS